MARIYLLNGCFILLTLITVLQLLRAGVRTLADRLFLIGVGLGAVLAGARPLLMVMGLLELNADGAVGGSSYWTSVLALTPLLAVVVISLFVFALVLDIMSGLKREATHDYLTGLLNRRGFEQSVGLYLDQPATALLVADIDDFKQINDRFGHAVGDDVIAAVGRVLAAAGGAEMAGRIGGEEFALFYRRGTRGRLEVSAQAIRGALSDLRLAGLPADYRLTISLGLHVREGQETLNEMMRRADRALYDAKAAGKNRAVLTPLRLRSV